MKISQTVWIDEKIKWSKLKKWELCKKNRYKGRVYIVCTSPHSNLLFEIIEARYLSEWYHEATLLGLCRDRQQAVEMVATLINDLYNEKTKTYEELQR